MKTISLYFILIICATAYPQNSYRYVPKRKVMFGGYYGYPLDSRSYIPSRGMTALAAGDTIATNSFIEEDEVNEADNLSETFTKKPVVETVDEDVESDSSTVKPKRIPKRKPQKPQPDEEEEEDSSWPFQSQVPAYNAFFPIMIGGGLGSRAKNGGEEGFYPGSATAIANSFSTGKGGVATSHATSFGDPYLSSFFRNMNTRKIKPHQD